MAAAMIRAILYRSGAASSSLEAELHDVITNWETIVLAAAAQNRKLQAAYTKSREVFDLLQEINTFLDQLEVELPGEGVVTEPPELSQRTYRLLQLRDRTDRKSCVLDRLSSTVSELLEGSPTTADPAASSAGPKVASNLGTRLTEVQSRWSSLTAPVSRQYTRMKEASTDYGEFKTLVAQEWKI